MTSATRTSVWLARTWWVIFPLFAALTLRLAVERSCAEPYDLLPGVSSQPLWAWSIALVYLLAHVWVIATYLRSVASSGTLLPPRAVWRAMGSGDRWKLAAMAAAFCAEYAPLALWRAVGGVFHCGA